MKISSPIPILLTALTGLIVLLLAYIVDQQIQSGYRSNQREQVVHKLDSLRTKLESVIYSRLYLVEGVVPYVMKHPRMTGGEFSEFAGQVLTGRPGVYSLQLLRGDRLIHSYPDASRETRWAGASLSNSLDDEATLRQGLRVTGPYLEEGGRRFVAVTTPIYSHGHSGELWGAARALLDLDELLFMGGTRDKRLGLKLTLAEYDGRDGSTGIFFGRAWEVHEAPIVASLLLPGSEWLLAAAPEEGWRMVAPGGWLWRFCALVAVVLAASGVWVLVSGPLRLREAVQQATSHLSDAHYDLEVKVKERTSELVALNSALQEREYMLAEAQRIGHLGNWIWHLRGDEWVWSDEVYRILNQDPQKIVPTYETLMQRVHKEDRERVARELQNAIAEGRHFCFDHRIILENGRERTVQQQGEVVCRQDGEPQRVLGTIQDVTEWKEIETRLFELSNYDALTALPNRSLLRDRLGHAMDVAHRTQRLVALIIIDIDQFKTVNDSLGHEFGDKLITIIAKRINQCIRSDDTLARLGGDEFGVIFEGLVNIEYVAIGVKKILKVLTDPVVVEGQEVFVTASAGISLFPEDGRDVDTLMKHADLSMYRAKELGRNSYQFFSSDMGAQAFKRMALETQLRHALEKDEFSISYQPLVDIATGELSGFEALVRWQHPKMGEVPPAHFVPFAEENGLVIALGERVLHKVCRQYQQWRSQGLTVPPINVNLSAYQFREVNLVQSLPGVLARYALDTDCIGLEITESALMQDSDGINIKLEKLKAQGFRVSIDDFGTGHSSLSYLKRFNIDCLKIDRSFIRDIVGNDDDKAIVEAIILMAHKLNLRVVAEGIENREQLEILRKSACDVGQGYYFSKPLPAPEVYKYIINYTGYALPGHMGSVG